MADKTIIAVAQDIATHKIHIAHAKSLPTVSDGGIASLLLLLLLLLRQPSPNAGHGGEGSIYDIA